VITPGGYVVVTDTGNKRLVVYDNNGKFISQLGGEGDQLGQFNEPVGIAMDTAGNIYVADAWNKRVQVLAIDAQGNLTAKSSWPVDGWDGESDLKKPGIAVSGGHIFVPDPLKFTVLEFDPQGTLLRTYDLAQAVKPVKGVLTGIASDGAGGLWVSDSANHVIYHLLPGK
jgi:DNA-binding beta-propeller fold protein YncE